MMVDLQQRWRLGRAERIGKIADLQRCDDCLDAATIMVWLEKQSIIPDRQLCVACWSQWETTHLSPGWAVTPAVSSN